MRSNSPHLELPAVRAMRANKHNINNKESKSRQHSGEKQYAPEYGVSRSVFSGHSSKMHRSVLDAWDRQTDRHCLMLFGGE